MIDNALWLFAMCLVLGSGVGLLAGLLGIGGGLVVVPALVWLLPRAGVGSELVMHIALATSLASIVLTSGSSARNHIRLGNVDFSIVKTLAPGVIIGGLGGSVIAELVPTALLPKIFAVIVLLLALQMLASMRFTSMRPLPGPMATVCSGGVIGVVSSLAGIGGGSLTVPYLSLHGVEMRRAIGSASLSGALIAVAGMAGFITAGIGDETLPPMSIGYVYLPALLGIVMTSMLTTRYGAALVSRLPTMTLKKIFAVFLLFISLEMFLG
ncbi:sulfite exporter TauE/SafE family protein [Photobacterium alginatilyticum]|uniref:Probable membrane transporter protein n=1 Tax=Photobacterium alginatilyticum TaxID=1775171 RepID=A0ABW9YFB0_9GAMM|nr:sulfite exporter TauE/SafE family protein [Photobacterium alginatilyticum]NBI52307.1 sulfite exporter TauE/SafE family protein [Photobacterium alginatilyticum]